MKEFLDAYAEAPDDLGVQSTEAEGKQDSERWHLTRLRRNRLN